MFEEAASGFGFFLMGRESDKRDVYIEIILRDSSGGVEIVRQLTGADPLNEGGQQYVAYKLDPGSDYVIEGFVLTEESPSTSDSNLRDIFAVDDLVVAGCIGDGFCTEQSMADA